jgi:ANTAR domain-containing protein
VRVALPDLALQTASLLRLPTATEERALHQLAGLAAGQVRGCAAASVGVWRSGELAVQASSHPDATLLTQVQLDSGRGPMLDSLAVRAPIQCDDSLHDRRWPEYSSAAVRLGVRCSVTLCAGDEAVVVLSLLGLRPRAMALEELQLAGLVAAFSAALVGAVADYSDSRRTTVQLQDAAAGRELVDQAKGILMHALNCSADEALARIRDVSQRSNLRATEVAARVIDAQSGRAQVPALMDLSPVAGRRPGGRGPAPRNPR